MVGGAAGGRAAEKAGAGYDPRRKLPGYDGPQNCGMTKRRAYHEKGF